MSDPHFASALSRETDSEAAAHEVCQRALQQLGAVPDLALLFVSADHVSRAGQIAVEVCRQLGTEQLAGCTAESVVGGAVEVEQEPAMALWLAKLPGVSVECMHLDFERTGEGGTIVGWQEESGTGGPTSLILLGDPFTFPADVLLERMHEDRPELPIFGGMASAGHEPGANRLFHGPTVHTSGALALRLGGPVRVRSVVSQGCRPIGPHFVITRSERNVIQELGGLPAYQRLEDVFRELPTHDQRLVQTGLHLGRVVDEYQDHFEQGDFLIRNVVGIDADEGLIAISDYVRPGQTVSFHVRDHHTADGELRELLARARAAAAPEAIRGALLFTCNGRGTRLFPEPHHDAAAVTEILGDVPLAGFFAAGEIGPVGGRNFLHGFTASVVLFEAE